MGSDPAGLPASSSVWRRGQRGLRAGPLCAAPGSGHFQMKSLPSPHQPLPGPARAASRDDDSHRKIRAHRTHLFLRQPRKPLGQVAQTRAPSGPWATCAHKETDSGASPATGFPGQHPAIPSPVTCAGQEPRLDPSHVLHVRVARAAAAHLPPSQQRALRRLWSPEGPRSPDFPLLVTQSPSGGLCLPHSQRGDPGPRQGCPSSRAPWPEEPPWWCLPIPFLLASLPWATARAPSSPTGLSSRWWTFPRHLGCGSRPPPTSHVHPCLPLWPPP